MSLFQALSPRSGSPDPENFADWFVVDRPDHQFAPQPRMPFNDCMNQEVGASGALENVPVTHYEFVAYPEDDGIPVGGPMRREDPMERMVPYIKPKTRADRSALPSQEEADFAFSLQLQDGDTIITQNLVVRVDFELKSRRISQLEFARKVLGRSQGTLSSLMTRPKPWKNLNPAGRATYVKMLEWIVMSEKEKQRVFEGRDELVGEAVEKPKRNRFQFSAKQKEYLQNHFAENPYPNVQERRELAMEMDLDIKTIDNYFINTRKRCKNN